jgi:hypothetical protein
MMMNLSKLTLLSSLIILIGISCNKNETDTILIGKWQLVEQLVDPEMEAARFILWLAIKR